jgi:AraC-like DNA-binding protein
MTYSDQNIIHKIENKILVRPQVKLQDIARSLNIERHRIEKAVRVCASMSYRDYRKMLLARRAVDLLVGDSELPEKALAGKLGYKSLSAFIRFIKSSTGHTPCQLRKLYLISKSATSAHLITTSVYKKVLTSIINTNITYSIYDQ